MAFLHNPGDKMLVISHPKCVSCGGCVGICPVDALNLEEGRDLNVDNEKCINCAACVRFCPVGALKVKKDGKEMTIENSSAEK